MENSIERRDVIHFRRSRTAVPFCPRSSSCDWVGKRDSLCYHCNSIILARKQANLGSNLSNNAVRSRCLRKWSCQWPFSHLYLTWRTTGSAVPPVHPPLPFH